MWAGFCRQFGWRWSFWLHPVWPHLRGSGTFTSLLRPAFFIGVCFFPIYHTSASTHAAAVLEYSVCVIFIKILPSMLNTKSSDNSGGRTRGFGFLAAFTPGVGAPRLNQIPGWDYDLKINQSTCPSWCCCDLVEWICLNTDSVTAKKTKSEELRITQNTLVRFVIKKENTQHEIIFSFNWDLLSLRT